MVLATICLILWVIFLGISGIIFINPDLNIFKEKLSYERTLFTCNVLFFIFAALWIVFLFFEI